MQCTSTSVPLVDEARVMQLVGVVAARTDGGQRQLFGLILPCLLLGRKKLAAAASGRREGKGE